MREVLRKIGEDEDVAAVMPNLLYSERSYTTWRDYLLETQARASEKLGAQDLRSRLGRQ